MALLTLRDISLGFGGPNLLHSINLQIEKNERLCLLGRNGEGKSTLMKLIAGLIKADNGVFERQQGLKVAYLTQDVPADLSGSIYDVVASGLDQAGDLLTRYHHASLELAENYSDQAMAKLDRIQHELEAIDGWAIGQQIDTTLSLLQLSADDAFSSQSGGMKRRVLLARALVTQPDLLLLDEPTNHLDIESINWLEDFLLSWNGSLLFVTHDRSFLRNLATRIVELDRGQLTSWPGNYDTYLERKQQALESEARENALFDKKLAQEEVWIRQGIKARRTRNEGRVRALKALREERMQRRERSGTVKMQLSEQERSGKIVIEVDNISYSYDQLPIVKNLSTTILRGDRIGIIGPNGVGKSTLIQLLLGQLQPDSGTVKTGTKLDIAYFDQHRSSLDLNKSVRDNLAEGTDKIEINGRSKHVMSYLSDFLFAPDRANSPVSTLSGGERNRLMLARLFSRPFNMLVMDEPTNDLDVETLELLEELLLDYQGTLLLVSHDRAFLNNVVTSTLVFEGIATVNDYVGGYDDWIRQKQSQIPSNKTASIKSKNPEPKKLVTKKLSYKDQRELDSLPQKIELLEQEIDQLQAMMSNANFYQNDKDTITSTTKRFEEAEKELASAFERWEQLDSAN
ncbi:MAG: ATP-binding cassette domain-containing protein [Gammaproteobacteria bacterium]|nr:ATP-binding cassette domain-containing protein [Gammaproteobacteria bacterium]